jgi:ABC-type transport system involved in multi-copper enzyme maturation permease subunit
VYNQDGNPDGYLNYHDAFAAIHFYVSTAFSIITAILITKVILEEYQNKTISILFTYPHPRKRIMLAKLIFISLFAFITTVLASIVVGSTMVIQNYYIHAIPEEWTSFLLLEQLLRIFLFSIATVGISLVSYYIGMLQKSIPATIITPIFITLIGSGFYYGASLLSVILISIGLILVGGLLASTSLNQVEKADVQ